MHIHTHTKIKESDFEISENHNIKNLISTLF